MCSNISTESQRTHLIEFELPHFQCEWKTSHFILPLPNSHSHGDDLGPVIVRPSGSCRTGQYGAPTDGRFGNTSIPAQSLSIVPHKRLSLVSSSASCSKTRKTSISISNSKSNCCYCGASPETLMRLLEHQRILRHSFEDRVRSRH